MLKNEKKFSYFHLDAVHEELVFVETDLSVLEGHQHSSEGARLVQQHLHTSDSVRQADRPLPLALEGVAGEGVVHAADDNLLVDPLQTTRLRGQSYLVAWSGAATVCVYVCVCEFVSQVNYSGNPARDSANLLKV